MVERLMAQQEEIHNKLLEDMMRRDREMVEKEEAWKKMEMDRVNKELDRRAHEQSLAQIRHAAIIELLKRFTTDPPRENRQDHDHGDSNPVSAVAGGAPDNDDDGDRPEPSPNSNPPPPPPPSAVVSTSPVSSKTPRNTRASGNGEGADTGKRWPREEVLALINLRCSIPGSGGEERSENQQQHGQGGGGSGSAVRAPLWERISQGMSELGYKRSAKRCKEKWENINKYFRKTKDSTASKKRPPDSRTCPYFQQLTALYNQGKLAPVQSAPRENPASSPDSQPSYLVN